MRKDIVIILFLILSTVALAQKKEKIRGSKIVMIEKKAIGNFEAIEVSDNLEIYLEKGDKNELRIEADENLHNIIKIDLTDKTLRINTLKKASLYKKLSIRITYTNNLKSILAKNETIINAIEEIQLDTISIKSLDESKLFLNVNATHFSILSDDNSTVELNLKSEKTFITLNKNANLKALITASDLKFDMYQKAVATIEGDVANAYIRLDNNTALTATNLVLTNAQLLIENYSNCSINATTTLSIDATGSSNIKLYGNPKIEIKQFAEHAILSKKQKDKP